MDGLFFSCSLSFLPSTLFNNFICRNHWFFFFLESWPLSLGLSGVWIVGMLVNWRSEGKTKPWSVAIGKESACNAGDLGSTPGLGRSPGEGKSYPLQYFGLENSMSCIVHGVAKSGTWLSDLHFHFTFPGVCIPIIRSQFQATDVTSWNVEESVHVCFGEQVT